MSDGFQPLIRVESAEEQYAYMLARFGDPAGWSITSQRFDSDPEGRDVERVELTLGTGDTMTVGFVAAREDPLFETGEPDDGTEFLDRVMETASTFSRENPPHHPGTLARFPVPSAGYANALAVPMPVLAVDRDGRGLFAPPRVVVVGLGSFDVLGVTEYPGFDPDHWPPARVSNWPPPSVSTMHRQQLQGTIMRFSALWKRVVQAWFDQESPDSAALAREVEEALDIRSRIDAPEMVPYYDRLNPAFARWLGQRSRNP